MKENQKPENEHIDQQEANAAEGHEEELELPEEGSPASKEDEQTAILSQQVAEWQDKYMRLSAEFDNFRKRTLKEKLNLIDSASEDVIKCLLPVIDDMDRAMEANKVTEDIIAVKSGVDLVYKKFYDTLTGKGLTEIKAMGEPFDTDMHEAVARFPVENKKQKGKVIDVVEKGYKLKDKVIRFSKVIVGE